MAVLGFALLSSAPDARADARTASLKGLVQSAKGEALSGVLVVLRAASGQEWKVTADDHGRFEIPGLTPGHYTMTLLKGLGGVGESLRREVDVKGAIEGVTDALAANMFLVVWDEKPKPTSDRNLLDELKYAIRSSPKDALEDRSTPEIADEPEPVIEHSDGGGAIAAQTMSGDVQVSPTVSLHTSASASSEIEPGLTAGFQFDSPIYSLATLSIAAKHLRGGSLSSPFLTGAGMHDEELRLLFHLDASPVDDIEVEGAIGHDFVPGGMVAGHTTLDRNDETTLGSFQTRWHRGLGPGDLKVRFSYARGVLNMTGLTEDDLSQAQSFWSAHAAYTASLDDHEVAAGAAYRADRAHTSLAAWPGAYDSVAGLISRANDMGSASAYVRDAWRIGSPLSVRYGIALYYPVSDPNLAYASPEAGVDLRLWRDGVLSVTGSYVWVPPGPDQAVALGALHSSQEGYTAVRTELAQLLPEGASLKVFAGNRDLRTLYQEATAGELGSDAPNPLFYTTGFAESKEAGLSLSSAPMGKDSTITLSYIRGRTDGAISVSPFEYLRRDLATGGRALLPARVGYSQAAIAVVIPRAGTALDLCYVELNTEPLQDYGASEKNFSLWGAQVRQDLPFMDFADARFAVLVAVNQVLADLYKLEAIESNPTRTLRVSGGLGLTF